MFLFFSLVCTPPLVFTMCMKKCQYCHIADPECDILRDEQCVEGCDCPFEMVHDGNDCVHPSSCSCENPETGEPMEVGDTHIFINCFICYHT